MYESPIEIIQKQMQMQMDGEILKAVQGVGVNVNKEELIKALAYDREQYSKGYKDGVKEFAELIVADYPEMEFYLEKLLAEMVGGKNA